MLTDLAAWLVDQTEILLASLGLFAGLFGFLLAQIVMPRFVWPLHRVGFAAAVSALYLLAVFGYLLPRYLGPQTNPTGLVSFFISGLFFAMVLGFGVGLSARARSISISGRSGLAVLALIPGLNVLFAIYMPSKLFADGPPARWYAGRLGIVAAVSMATLATGLLNPGLRSAVYYTDYNARKADIEARYWAQFIEDTNLSDALWRFAGELSDGYWLDDDIYLLDVAATGDELQFRYQISAVAGTAGRGADGIVGAEILKDSCDTPALRVFLQAGAQLQHVFVRANGGEIESVTVILPDCQVLTPDPTLQVSAGFSALSPQN